MKKIVSLVLALVLVLAFAAPAMAITGSINPTTTSSAYAPFYDIDLVLIEAPLSGIGVLSLQAVAANKAYIKDGLVHFALYYKTGVKGTGAGTITMHDDDYASPAALISSDIVTFYPTTVQEYSISGVGGITQTILNGAGVLPVTNSKSISIPLQDPTAAVASYVIIGSGAVSVAANGTILAEILGVETSLKFDAITLDETIFDGIITAWGVPATALKIYAGKTLKYTVSATTAPDPAIGSTDTIVTYNVLLGATTTSVQFVSSKTQTLATGSTKNLSGIQVVYGGVTYLVVDQGSILAGGGGSSLKFYDAGVEVTTPATVAALTAAYTGVMTDFGFNYTAAGVLHPEHFAKKASVFYAYDSAAITLYTSAITVPDADTDVPQTGDAATSIGFVMIALAIVAACGVAYKKVRA